MTWRDVVRRPQVWLTLLAFALGSVAGWAASGQYAVALGAVGLLISLAVQALLVRWQSGCVGWLVLPLYVVAGWGSGVRAWHGSLVWSTLAFAAVLWPRAGLACSWIGQRPGAIVASIVAAYGLVGAAVALGSYPVWSLLALLTVPAAGRVAQAVLDEDTVRRRVPGLDQRLLRENAAILLLVVFIGQVMIGLLIKGLVR